MQWGLSSVFIRIWVGTDGPLTWVDFRKTRTWPPTFSLSLKKERLITGYMGPKVRPRSDAKLFMSRS